MERNIFSPKVPALSADELSLTFMKGAQWLLSITLGLLPVWFIPYAGVSLGFTKAIFVVAGVYVALLFACLSLLRSGKVSLVFSPLLGAFWLYTIAAFTSAFLSGDTFDSLFGVSFDVQSAFFTLLLAVVMTMSLVYVRSKGAVVRLLLIMSAALVVIYGFSIIRFLFGPEIFSFGFFNSSVITLVGGLNDLALYAGLCIVILLVSLNILPNNIIARTTAVTLAAASLFVLAVVNFSFVWLVVGFLSLLMFLYYVAKDTWLKPSDESSSVSRFILTFIAGICIVSGMFVISGDYLGAKMSNLTGINYLEVRPSVEATLDITKSIYRENAFTGIGPNRFEDAWRLYKDPIINETQFWGTTFVSGNSYALTLLATTGVFGAISFLIFILSFIYTGYRLMFTRPVSGESDSWGILGNITFAAATYLWIMSFWYTPGATILLLAALFTGLMVAVKESRRSTPVNVLNVAHSRQHGFLLIASSVVLIIFVTNALISAVGVYRASLNLTKGIEAYAESGDSAPYDNVLQNTASVLPDQDIYVSERARLRLTELNRLFSLSEPNEDDQKRFEALLVEGVKLAESAIVLDRTNPFNQALLASFYGLLNPSQFDGISERRDGALQRAKELDPTNPEYGLLSAQIALRFGEIEKARAELTSSLALKGNYTDALFLLSQIDIQAGNATSAIATTRSIISLEPTNPGRRYQLGLLLLATQDLEEAIQAFSDAITLDPNYANARYMLALTLLDLGSPEPALEQLKIVAATNTDNEMLQSLINQIESGINNPEVGEVMPVSDASGVETFEQAVTSNPPDTSLVSPVNRVPKSEEVEETSPESGE